MSNTLSWPQISSLFTPLVGHLVDRHGVRPVAMAASVGMVASLIGLSYIQSLASFAACLSLLRFSGPECMAVCINTALFRWSVRVCL